MTGSNTAHNHYCIIHGHFYQPPREDPWLNFIQRQPSAAPYHDWNERIAEECYRPNAFSRILDGAGMIRQIHNNYENLSFNFGPTLWLWLEQNYPAVCERIIQADRTSAQRLDGHGNALAQVYNHLIMPLASRRDQHTQIRWAKQFFASRFGREPEGMWLAETAINDLTAQCLVEEGIRFAVLAPTQAAQFRRADKSAGWQSNDTNSLSTLHPYRLFPFSSEKNGHLDIFFFDEALSRATSFEGVLNDSGNLAQHILDKYTPDSKVPECVIIATDGETFGHHKPFADMCLAYFFAELAHRKGIKPVNFGYLLHKFPPQASVVLRNATTEGTAWSCAHGTGRWIRDCGCSTGGGPGWNQKWRTPLRLALDKCQVKIDKVFASRLKELGLDPWATRDRYIPQGESCTTELAFEEFLAQERHTGRALTTAERDEIRRLLDAQKFMLFAYTSCGWFFNDISGIETVQNLAYAGRALQLLGENSLRDETLETLRQGLAKAHGNIAGQTGLTLFDTYVLPWWRDRELLAFAAALQHVHTQGKGHMRLSGAAIRTTVQESAEREIRGTTYHLCRVHIARHLTGEVGRFDILVTRARSGAVSGHVRQIDHDAEVPRQTISPQTFTSAPNTHRYLLSDLFDASRSMLSRSLQASMAPAMVYASLGLHQQYESDLETLAALGYPLGSFIDAPLRASITVRFNRELAALKSPSRSLDQIYSNLLGLHEQSRGLGIALDLEYARELLEDLLNKQLDSFAKTLSPKQCDRMRYLLNIVDRFTVPVRKNHLEDTFHSILEGPIAVLHKRAKAGDVTADERQMLIRIIGFARRMNFNTDTFSL